jgi:hypothetical protein
VQDALKRASQGPVASTFHYTVFGGNINRSGADFSRFQPIYTKIFSAKAAKNRKNACFLGWLVLAGNF